MDITRNEYKPFAAYAGFRVGHIFANIDKVLIMTTILWAVTIILCKGKLHFLRTLNIKYPHANRTCKKGPTHGIEINVFVLDCFYVKIMAFDITAEHFNRTSADLNM